MRVSYDYYTTFETIPQALQRKLRTANDSWDSEASNWGVTNKKHVLETGHEKVTERYDSNPTNRSYFIKLLAPPGADRFIKKTGKIS